MSLSEGVGLGKRSPRVFQVEGVQGSSQSLSSRSSASRNRPLQTLNIKKRGRQVFSNDLENHLLELIRREWPSVRGGPRPDRVWISRQARDYISMNKVNMKCSKGWLDKFMKRNAHVINMRGDS